MTKEKDSPHRYWLFQSNHKVLRLRDALRMEALCSFPVRAHADRIQLGDKVIIWQTGKMQGCYALATITSEVALMELTSEEKLYFRQAEKELTRVSIAIEYNLWNRPIQMDVLQKLSAFAEFHAGLPGTNYRATQEQYETLAALIHQQDVLQEPASTYFINPGFHPPLNLILYGPPGTGKTYRTVNHALAIIENRPLEELDLEDRQLLKKRFDQYQEEGRIAFVTFHQSFTYEDFIEGIKPVVEDGQLNYKVESGIFKQLSQSAQDAIDETSENWSKVDRFVLIIDEINRANLPAIFGELISLIEPNKRARCAEQ